MNTPTSIPTNDTPAPPERPRAASASANSDTIEDWLATARPPVADGDLSERFFLICDAHRKELLTVSQDGTRLLHLRPGHDLDGREGAAMFSEAALGELEAAPRADGGWLSQVVDVVDTRNPDHRPPRGVISGLRGLVCDGVACALVQFDGLGDGAERDRYVEIISFDEHSKAWRKLEVPGQSGVLLGGSVEARVHVPSTGGAVIYAKTTATSGSHEDVSLIFRDTRAGQWCALVARFPKSPHRYSYRLVDNETAGSLGTLLRFGADAVVHSKELFIETEPGFDPELRCEPRDPDEWRRTDLGAEHPELGALAASRFVPIPGRPDSFVLMGQDGRLFTVTGFAAKPRVTSLDDGELRASTIRAALDHAPANGGQPRVALICVDASPDRRAWIKRERANAVGQFHPWVCLGDQTRALAVAEHMVDGTELFVVNDDGDRRAGAGVTIEHLSLDPAGESWHNEILELSKPEIEPSAEACRVHSSKISLKTKEGIAAGRAVVGLRSSYPCVAIVNGLARHLSPSRALPVIADGAGQLSIKVSAESIDAPVYTLELADSTAEVRANEAVARRLGGKEEHEQIDAQRLVDRGLLPGSKGMDDPTRRRFANMIQAAGFAMGQRAAGVGADPAHYSLADDCEVRCFCGTVKSDVADGIGPSCFVTQFDGHTHGRINPDKPVTNYDEPGQLSGGFLADLVRWIKRTAQKVFAFFVNIGRGVVEFTLELAERVVKFTMNTIDGIAQGIEALVESVGRAINHVIDGAKRLLEVATALFNIPSIVRTNEVLGHLLDSGLGFARRFVANDLDKLTSQIVDGVVERIDGALEEVKGLLEGLTVGDVAAKGLADREGGSGASGRRELLGAAGIQAGWVFDRARSQPDAVTSAHDSVFAAEANSGSIGERLERLARLFINDANIQDPETLLGVCVDICADIAKLFQNGPSNASLLSIVEYLQRFVRLGANMFKAGVSVILGLIGDAIELLRTLLNQDLKIPGIDQLAQLALGRSLKVRDLITLGLSVAGTVLWKIIHEGKEPFDEDLHERIVENKLLTADADDSMSDGDGELVVYFVVQIKRMFGGDANENEKRLLTNWAKRLKEPVHHLKWTSTVLSFFYYTGYFFVAIPINAARDGANMIDYGNEGAQKLDIVAKVFAVGSVCIAALGVVINAVQATTIEFLPDSPEAKLWAAQRATDLVPPLSWVSLTWILYLVFGVTGLLCSKSLGRVGAVANLVINMTAGLVIMAGSAVYLHFYIQRNAGRIRPWKIAEEISKIIWAIPGLTAFMVPVVFFSQKIPKIGPPVALVLGSVVLVLNVGIEAICCVIHTGSLIDENHAKRWSDFSGQPPTLALSL